MRPFKTHKEIVDLIFDVFFNNDLTRIREELYELIENLSNDEIDHIKDVLENSKIYKITFSRRLMLSNNKNLIEELIEKRKIEIRNNKLKQIGI